MPEGTLEKTALDPSERLKQVWGKLSLEAQKTLLYMGTAVTSVARDELSSPVTDIADTPQKLNETIRLLINKGLLIPGENPKAYENRRQKKREQAKKSMEEHLELREIDERLLQEDLAKINGEEKNERERQAILPLNHPRKRFHITDATKTFVNKTLPEMWREQGLL